VLPEYLPQLSDPARRWVRFAGLVVVITLLSWLIYQLGAVFTPLLVALAIAYIVNPVVTWLERVSRFSRLAVVVTTFALLAVLVLAGGLYIGGKLLAQLVHYVDNHERYHAEVLRWLNALIPVPAADEGTASQPASAAWLEHVAPYVQDFGAKIAQAALAYLRQATSSIINIISLLVLIPLYTFFFLWRFNEIVRTIHDHLPLAWRDQVVHTARTIDAAIANFFRGRLMVCAIVGTLTGIGWTILGVPYSLMLGLLAGTLNIVPYMSLLALPPALFFTYVGATQAGQPWAVPALLTMGVYMLVQAIESFVLSPTIEGQSSGLHPVTITVALLIGAQLAGLLGMLLSIPVTSTLKTLAAELVLPEIRRLAGVPPEPQPAAAAPADAPPREANANNEPGPPPGK
jgi:predicted PurR-regulated permease PerM